MQSSRMCTAAHYHMGVSLRETPPWQRPPLTETPPGQRLPWTETPPWTESQTGVKTLPCRNFVVGGNNWKQSEIQLTLCHKIYKKSWRKSRTPLQWLLSYHRLLCEINVEYWSMKKMSDSHIHLLGREPHPRIFWLKWFFKNIKCWSPHTWFITINIVPTQNIIGSKSERKWNKWN